MIPMSAEIRINVRTTAEIKRDIEITARLKGLTVSSLINYLAVQAIREEKERDPMAFQATNNATPASDYGSTRKKIHKLTDDKEQREKAA